MIIGLGIKDIHSMTTYHIVTDSAANLFGKDHSAEKHLSVVPYRLMIDGYTFREGIDITTANGYSIIEQAQTPPKLLAPSVEDYVKAFRYGLEQADVVISIHTSREITNSWQNAQAAAQSIGHKGVIVIDSQSICAGQGMLVRVALDAITHYDDAEEVIRTIRGAIEQIYAIYYVESIEYLQHNNIMSPSHTLLGGMLGMKPFLTIEEGRILPVEKVKTRPQAVERLVEFIIEFTELEAGVILQPQEGIYEMTTQLQERLALEFTQGNFPFVGYNPSLMALIGINAIGICIHEKAWQDALFD
jgi:DegV family protein with EDD domain